MKNDIEPEDDYSIELLEFENKLGENSFFGGKCFLI